ncbi:YcaO-like family protein [Roseobacter sinensis]|uniref:YcaO-like family protein n=1 Tax=Roseobacter sinensis TaxID=2931391 RepID=A0ABT3BGZ5_9RHOB|nr:YcaO-like family protein [Roseobacter sp. WL0113]MCV3272838.1 YcaO-like family protein [Roseobacter sp. WL0113]
MDLTSHIEKQFLGGSQRICAAEETLTRILPHQRAFGITRLANVTGLDRVGLPVVIAIRPNARSIAVSQGKGMTLAHAKASALMESIEIWHAERLDQPVFYASIADLEAEHSFVNLDRLPGTPHPQPPRTERQHWVIAQDILNDCEKLVPFEMVHADYTYPVAAEAGRYPASTNGLASGNHVMEAICHGICEVIERDALALWHAAPLRSRARTRLDPGTINDRLLQQSLAKFEAAGLRCAIWEATSDAGVPSFVAVLHDPEAQADHIGLGSGTHPDPVIALHRTLNEAAQTRLNYISGAREDLFHDEYSAEGRAAKAAEFADLLQASDPQRTFGQTTGVINTTVGEDLDWLKNKLQSIGTEEICVVDLTRDPFRIPVVRVIIPGLEAPHDDVAYVPGPRALAAADRLAI